MDYLEMYLWPTLQPGEFIELELVEIVQKRTYLLQDLVCVKCNSKSRQTICSQLLSVCRIPRTLIQ